MATPKGAIRRPPDLDLDGLRRVVFRSIEAMRPKHEELVYCHGYVQVDTKAWQRIQCELDGLRRIVAPEKRPGEDDG